MITSHNSKIQQINVSVNDKTYRLQICDGYPQLIDKLRLKFGSIGTLTWTDASNSKIVVESIDDFNAIEYSDNIIHLHMDMGEEKVEPVGQDPSGVYVIWDYNNIPVPQNVNPIDMVQCLSKFASQWGSDVRIKVFTTTIGLDSDTRKILRGVGCQIILTEDSLLSDIDHELNYIPLMSTVVMITGSTKLVPSLHQQVVRGLQVCIIYQHANPDLIVNNSEWMKTISLPDLLADMKCPFNEPKPVALCKHFQKPDRCQYPGCKFRHVCSHCQSKDHGLSDCPLIGSHRKEKIGRYSIEMCRTFNAGKECEPGCAHKHICFMCKENHPIVKCPVEICSDYNSIGGCSKDKCFYRHVCSRCSRLNHGAFECKTHCHNCQAKDHSYMSCPHPYGRYHIIACKLGDQCPLKRSGVKKGEGPICTPVEPSAPAEEAVISRRHHEESVCEKVIDHVSAAPNPSSKPRLKLRASAAPFVMKSLPYASFYEPK